MNYKLVSSKQIIAKVFRDLKPDNGSWTADAMEWIGEALEFIGVYSGLDHKFDDVPIKNFRGPLPCDLHVLCMVEYNGRPLRYGSSPQIHALHRDPNAFINPHALASVTAYFKSDTDGGPLTSFKQVDSRIANSEFYVLDPGKIETSFESGTVRIHYLGLPVDKDSYPLVPDNVIVKDAILWYILSKMIMGGYSHPVFSYADVDYKWEKTLGQAQNDLMFPSVDRMENFKHMWVTMLPNGNRHDDFYKY